ncbi:MAG: polyphosphate glucokinase [Verrucomicrobiota bacterium]|jgi:predicted NBD/HSP70 family sugar kinase
MPAARKKVLVVDIGGTHVKLLRSPREKREFDSGESMGPREFVARFNEAARGWKFDAVSIGFPAPVRAGRIIKEPTHLRIGWIGFNFTKALRKSTRVINDAAMQALGSYSGRGRVLFLGLGTGLGSALVWERHVMPLEFGHLPYANREVIEKFLGIPGIDRLGLEEWKREVLFAVRQLKQATIADRVVLGGGNVHRFTKLPAGIERGKNENAFRGGVRLWEKKWTVM